jgi:hypothetical protein
MIMRALLPIAFALVAGLAVLAAPSSSAAQQPKMDVKLFVGVSGTTFVSMLETGRLRETFAGWQIGFGPRIRKRVWFAEVQFSFNRWAFSFVDPVIGEFTGRTNSFELPFIAGYVPYKSSLFKLYLYGGLVNHFNTKMIVNLSDEACSAPDVPCTLKLRPKEIGFAIYQALARFGVNFDLAMFNFDFNYSISMNSATSTSYRTGYHQIQVNIAYLF